VYIYVGKSTLLRIIAGLDQEHDGYIQYPPPVDDTPIATYTSLTPSSDPPLDHTRRLVGWCPQHDALFEYLTIAEHFELFADLLGSALGRDYFDTTDGDERKHWRYSASKREKLFIRILSSLGIANQRSKHVYSLSGGMKRRLSLALASLGNPTLLLLDEPTSGCDSQTRFVHLVYYYLYI
jgi:ABC-type multidrug transport system ATPase subunit